MHYGDHTLSLRPSSLRPSSVGCRRQLFTYSTSPLKPLNKIQWNLIGSKISTSSTKFVFFGSIGRIIWPPWSLIGWDIFDFSSDTTKQNSTKLDRKQDLNVLELYQVCVFQADRKNKMAPLKPLNGIQRNLTGSKILTSSTKFVFFGPIGKTRWPPWPLIGWDIFDFSSVGWLLVVLRINVDLAIFQPYLDLEAGDDQSLKIQVARLGIEPRSSCSASQELYHSATAAPTSPLKLLNEIQQNLTGSKISTSSSSTKFVFFRPIGKTRWLPWPLIGWYIFDFSSETAERNSTKLDRK